MFDPRTIEICGRALRRPGAHVWALRAVLRVLGPCADARRSDKACMRDMVCTLTVNFSPLTLTVTGAALAADDAIRQKANEGNY